MKKKLLMMAALVCILATELSAQMFSQAFSFGAGSDDKVTAVKIDANGNMYFTGYFDGTVDFDPSIVLQTVTSTGGTDGFLLKLNSAGAFQWLATFDATGTNNVEALAMDLDPTNNIYITGYFGGTMDFNGAGSNTLTAANATDIFVAKFDNTGLVTWAKKAGSTGVDIGKSISIGANGNAYITGQFSGTVDFDPDAGATDTVYLTSNGGTDVFVWKLTPGGNISWAIGYGGTGGDDGSVVRVENGNVYTAGTFDGTADFNPDNVAVWPLTSTGTSSDVFIQKLDAQGNFIYARQVGNASTEKCYSIEVDQENNLYMAGSFQATTDFDPNNGTANFTSAGSYDGYILQLDSVANFKWARIVGGTGSDEINHIALGEFNNIYAVGDYAGTMDINTDAGATQTVNAAGGYDIFCIKLEQAGNYISGFAIGSGSSDNGNHIIVDALGFAYISGSYGSTMEVSPWQPAAGSLLTSNGGQDGFVAKYQTYYVGINDDLTVPQFIMYPNPAKQMFYLLPPPDFGTCTISVYNPMGQLALPVLQTNGNEKIQIKQYLPDGIYTVKLSGKKVLSKKLAIGF